MNVRQRTWQCLNQILTQCYAHALQYATPCVTLINIIYLYDKEIKDNR